MIRVRTLGHCAIQIGSIPVGPDAEIVFAALLLLTVEPGHRFGRSELLGMLWPEAKRSRAAHCLRQTLYRLRTLGVPLEVTGSSISVPLEAVDSDVDALLRTRRPDATERLADIIDGPFLPGYFPSFSDPLRDWVERHRDLVTAAARRVLVSALAARKSRAEWSDVERLAHRCLALDPLNEDATLALAEAAALHGGKAEAIGILDRYLHEMGPTARELRLPAMALRRRISEPELEFPLAPPLHVPFVGRSTEMATLTGALRAARGGAGSVHFIHGEPGIGKTRLLNEFSRAASLEGARVAAALCQSSDARRPLSAFVDLVPKLMTMPGALGCSPQSHKYLRRLIEHQSTVLPPTPDAAEGALLYASVRQSLFDLLDAIASEVPLLITIEDVHWLDQASREIVSEAAEWVASRRMLLVLTARGAEINGASTVPLLAIRNYSHWLGPIDQTSLARLFEANLRNTGHASSSTFRDWCVEMSGGNPYYLSELALRGLNARGSFEVPPTLATLVAARITRLQPVSRRVLQACAVLGKHATLDRIDTMLDQPHTKLLDAFDDLERMGLVSFEEGRLACRHGLLLEAALERASHATCAYLHRKAAMALAPSLKQARVVSLAWDCARHLLAAGERSQAAAILMDCARHALELGRPLEADEILRGSLDLPLSAAERLSLLAERAHALRAADQWNDLVLVLSELAASESEGRCVGHNDRELQLISAKWAAGYDANDLLSALRQCCLHKTSDAPHRLLAARFAFMLADNVCVVDVAHDIYSAVTPDLESDNASAFDRVYCRMLYNAAFGDINEAERAARELDTILRERSDVREICLARVHIGEVLRESGDLDHGAALMKQAYREGVENSLLWLACLAGRRLAWLHLDCGELDVAAEWVAVILPISERIQHVASRADVLGAAAELELRRGNDREAEALLAQSVTAWNNTQHVRSQAFWLASQAGVWLAQENHTACANVLPRFMELYGRVRRHCDQDQTTARLVRILDFTAQVETADRILDEYLWTYRRGCAPLSTELRELCDQRGLSIPASAQPRERPQAPAA